jgi:hypothetical protein
MFDIMKDLPQFDENEASVVLSLQQMIRLKVKKENNNSEYY